MSPETALTGSARHYAVVARAILFIREQARRQPTLEEVAAEVKLSPFHLQRLFAEWAGISPKRFLQVVTKNHARQQLERAVDSFTVVDDAGLSSISRLHDLMVSCEAMTPAEIRTRGAGLAIGFGFAATPFGEAILGWTARGVCHFAFIEAERATMLAELRADWPEARLERDDTQAQALTAIIFPATPTRGRVHLVLRGTNFQIKVWEALIRLGTGQLTSYQRLAEQIGNPHAQRAVGGALAANRIACLIPCHRVIRESGDIGRYRWGENRKVALLTWELAQTDNARHLDIDINAG